ncbi:MAG: ferric reductase-like transmembrane domain-containing protein, partial [bacterium]
MKKYSTVRVWFAVCLINLIPLLLWLTMKPVGERVAGNFLIFKSLGQITALLGYSLMATVIFLTARLGLVEKKMCGLNRVFINHHRLGAWAFILLMVHPLALTISYLTFSTQAAATFLIPGVEVWPQTLGTIALGIMMILLFITFYLSWRYQVWKFSHRFLVLAFIVGTAHLAFIASDVSNSFALRVYMLILAGVAFIAYGYRLLVEFGGIGKYQYKVSSVRELAAGVREISLQSVGKTMAYQAGQFAFFSFKQDGLSAENHPFSLISVPEEPELKIIVKELGDFTRTLAQLKVGSLVAVEGPYGSFGQLDAKVGGIQPKEIWIAGGIGITPFISLAKDLTKNGRSADLYYSVR